MLIHKREKPYMCKDCNKSFVYFGIFNKHMKSHTQYSPYTKCQQCDTFFLNSITLMKHMSVHNKPLEGADFLSSLPSELLSLLVCYCDLGTAISLGQSNISLLQVITHPRVWGKVLKRSRMERMEEEEVLLLMDQMLELLDLSLDPELLLTSLRATICARFPAKAWNSVTVGQAHSCQLQAVSTDGLFLLVKSRAKLTIQEAKIDSFLGVNISYGLKELGGPLLSLLSSLASQQPLPLERLSVSHVRITNEKDGEALRALLYHCWQARLARLNLEVWVRFGPKSLAVRVG